MKANLSIKAFSNAIAIATRACQSGKATMPILSCILLSASKEKQRVYLTCTNLDTRITTSLAAPVEEGGELCVSASIFSQIIRALPGETVSLVDKKNQVLIESGGSKFRLHTISSQEFPPAQTDTKEPVKITFEQDDLLARLATVAPAMSTDETRYMLNGVFIQQQKSKFNFVATDGRRLHVNSSKRESEVEASMVLPGSSVSKLEALLGVGKKVEIALFQRWVTFEVEREEGVILMHSKVVEGTYPQYDKVVPSKASERTFNVNRNDLCQAFKRVSLSVSEKNRAVTMKIEANSLRLSASSPDFGDANEEVIIDNPGDKVAAEVAMNPQFMISALDSSEEETVKVKVTDGVSPICLHIGDLFSVIMPVRLS
jgi:DNA polymerase III subunit beta